MERERWKPVVGYEGWYEVSDQCRVKRVKTTRTGSVNHIITGYYTPRGYHRVRLCKHPQRKHHFVQRLVAAAFIGPRPHGMQVNHINGDKADNRPPNLEYVTGSENQRHSFTVGRVALRGEERSTAKLTAEKARSIIRQRKEGWTHRRLAEHYGVHGHTIWQVLVGRTWWHATGLPQRVRRALA